MLDYGRPCGIQPKIYSKKPEIEDDGENPFTPSIEQFDSELQARAFYKKHYPNSYKELVVE
jgi:hypothetical protein